MKPWRNQLTTVTEIKPLSGDLKSQTREFVCSNSKQESLCAAIQNRTFEWRSQVTNRRVCVQQFKIEEFMNSELHVVVVDLGLS